MVHPALILLRGYPGSGKTTIGKRLQKDGVGTFIDHNAILTLIASMVGNDKGIYDDIHKLEQVITNKLLNEGTNVIVARGFSTESSIKPYSDIAIKNQADIQIFRLAADESTLSKRVSAEERKKDFNPITSKRSLNAWIDANPQVGIKNEHIIDANQPIEKVLSQIKSIL